MEKKENIKEYLQKMLDRWNKYDVLDGFVAENFRTDLEKTLEYWDLRIADNKQELDKAREEGRKELVKEIREAIRENMNKNWNIEKRHIAIDEDIVRIINDGEITEMYTEGEGELKDGGWGWYS